MRKKERKYKASKPPKFINLGSPFYPFMTKTFFLRLLTEGHRDVTEP